MNLLDLIDRISDTSSRAVRGYTSGEKIKRAWNLPPGAPRALGPGGTLTPEAERYAAQMLAAESGRPAWAAGFFNKIALGDLARSAEQSASVKRAGELGYAAGSRRGGY